MKKLINRPEDVVREELEGFAAAHGERLKVYTDPAYIVRSDAAVAGRVAIVSGGGSGHEPMHGGFVGRGMLDAACPGEVFTSPTPDQMLAATKAVDGGAGVLHIVKNYTGDVMNFEMAAELARDEGIAVEQVVIDDDVAVQDSLYTAGRRGVGTTVLAEKICGAASEQGRPLQDVAELCRTVNANGRSMGVALTSSTVPMVGKPTFDLGPGEIELGIGIHGEPGRERRERRDGARSRRDAGGRGTRRSAVRTRRRGARLRERYGGHPAHGAVRGLQRAAQAAERQGHHHRSQPRRLLHHLPRHGRLFHHAPAPGRGAHGALGRAGGYPEPAVGRVSETISADGVAAWLRAFAAAVTENRDYLTELDAAIGDADHGVNMDRGMQAVLGKLDGLGGGGIDALLKGVGMTLVSTVGGAAGPLYGTLFLRMASAAGTQRPGEVADASLTLARWASAVEAGVAGVQARGKAEPGDKTMVDALVPAAAALRSAAAAGVVATEALRQAAEAARHGMEATIPLVARKGRASYLGERSAGHQDPGATSAWLLMETAVETLVASDGSTTGAASGCGV